MTAAVSQGQPVEVSGMLYLYGLVLRGAEVPRGTVGVLGEPVRTVPAGEVDAVVSEVVDAEVVGTPAEVRAHAAVLDLVGAALPVLPVRFGTVVDDVALHVLDSQDEVSYVEQLERLADVTQLSLRVRYVEEVVLAELVAEDAEIRRLREAVHGRDPDAAYYDRVRLGELVVAGFRRKRQADAAALEEAIAPHVADLRRRPDGDVTDALDAALLVRRADVARVEEVLEGLAADRRERMTFRLLGPQAPYDFVET